MVIEGNCVAWYNQLKVDIIHGEDIEYDSSIKEGPSDENEDEDEKN